MEPWTDLIHLESCRDEIQKSKVMLTRPSKTRSKADSNVDMPRRRNAKGAAPRGGSALDYVSGDRYQWMVVTAGRSSSKMRRAAS